MVHVPEPVADVRTVPATPTATKRLFAYVTALRALMVPEVAAVQVPVVTAAVE